MADADSASRLPPPVPETAPELHGFIRLLLDRGWLIVSCALLAFFAAFGYVALVPRVYEARAVVQVEQEDAKVVKAEQVVSEDLRGLDTLNTVAQKLSNPWLLQDVLEANHLLPPATTPPSLTNSIARDELLTRYERNVKTILRRNTRLIDIIVRNTDPERAALIANGLISEYLSEDARAQHSTTGDASAFLQEEAGHLKQKLEASEQAIEDYRKNVGSISLEQSQDIITPQLQDLNRRLTERRAARIQAEGAYNDAMQMPSEISKLLAYPEVAADPDVVATSAELVKSENEFALMRQRYREQHPKYLLAAAAVTALKERQAQEALAVRARTQESVRVALQRASTSEQGLETEFSATQSKAMLLSSNAVRFNVLSREVQSDQALFDSVISRLGETTVAAHLTPERIRVIQPASPPAKASSPKAILILSLVLCAGLIMGLSGAFVLDSLDSSFRTAAEVERVLRLPVLGVIQETQRARGAKTVLLTGENGDCSALEAFRALGTTLSMLGREKDRRTFLFTSSLLSEGKTFTSINFAASLAQQGFRVLLVDADLRRPKIEETLTGQRSTPELAGLADYFAGGRKLHELCRQHGDISNLFWMASGSRPSDPGKLLAAVDFQKFLDDTLAYYDRIIIDTPPLLSVSDALPLAPKAQTVVLVVQACKTSRKGVERSVRMLAGAGASVAGIVLNLLPHRLFSGYYYSYYAAPGHRNGDGAKPDGKISLVSTDSSTRG